MFFFLQLTSNAIIVFNDCYQVVGIFRRDLCDDFSVDDFVLGAGMTHDIRRAPHGA